MSRHQNSTQLDQRVFRNTANTVKKVNIARHTMRGGIRFWVKNKHF